MIIQDMFDRPVFKNNFDIIFVTIIIALITGTGITVFFLWIDSDSYSSIYILPDSIVHDSNNNSVFYTYGIKSSESRTMDYNLSIYFNDAFIKSKVFTLNKGENLVVRDMIPLPPNIAYPSKVSLILTTTRAQEEVHFWLQS